MVCMTDVRHQIATAHGNFSVLLSAVAASSESETIVALLSDAEAMFTVRHQYKQYMFLFCFSCTIIVYIAHINLFLFLFVFSPYIYYLHHTAVCSN